MSGDATGAAKVEAVWRTLLVYQQIKYLRDSVLVAASAEDRLKMMADQQFEWNKFLYDRYQQKIVPLEDRMLGLSNRAQYTVQYAVAQNRASASALTAFAQSERELRDTASLWCSGATKGQARKLAHAKALASVQAQAAGIRVEDAKEKADEEIIYSRLVNAANLGRGFMADARASAATSAQLWTNIAQAAGQAAAGNLQGLGDNLSRLLKPFDSGIGRTGSYTNGVNDDPLGDLINSKGLSSSKSNTSEGFNGQNKATYEQDYMGQGSGSNMLNLGETSRSIGTPNTMPMNTTRDGLYQG